MATKLVLATLILAAMVVLSTQLPRRHYRIIEEDEGAKYEEFLRELKVINIFSLKSIIRYLIFINMTF